MPDGVLPDDFLRAIKYSDYSSVSFITFLFTSLFNFPSAIFHLIYFYKTGSNIYLCFMYRGAFHLLKM